MNEVVKTAMARVTSINGNLIACSTDMSISMNEQIYVIMDGERKKNDIRRLKAEIIRIRNSQFDAQVFEDNEGIKVGQPVELCRGPLSIELRPGLLGQVFDSLGRPLEQQALHDGVFLKRGVHLNSWDDGRSFEFESRAKSGDVLRAGQALGIIKEGAIDHRVMVPFVLGGSYRVIEVRSEGAVKLSDTVAVIEQIETLRRHSVTLTQTWPVRKTLLAREASAFPEAPLCTGTLVDALMPIAEGGAAAVAGHARSGKTAILKSMMLHSDVDVVIVAACGQRPSEFATLLADLRNNVDGAGRCLMERTIVIANTLSMPGVGSEMAISTAITIGEYYRHMGLKVLVVVDALSHWALAARDMSCRLEEMVGEEAYPSYLNSVIAGFFARAGSIRIADNILGTTIGSLTLIGAVDEARSSFTDPVLSAVKSSVGCLVKLGDHQFLRHRFPAIDLSNSWSKYLDSLEQEIDLRYAAGFVERAKFLKRHCSEGQAIAHRMTLLGDKEATSVRDFVHVLKSNFLQAHCLALDALIEFDGPRNRQQIALLQEQMHSIMTKEFSCTSQRDARETFLRMAKHFRSRRHTEGSIQEHEINGIQDVADNQKLDDLRGSW